MEKDPYIQEKAYYKWLIVNTQQYYYTTIIKQERLNTQPSMPVGYVIKNTDAVYEHS